MKKLLLLVTLPVCLSCHRDKERIVDMKKYFDEYHVTGSFILYDRNKGEYIRYNPERCEERFSPASTFKIPNSIILLEEGILKDENSVIRWDSIETPVSAWNKDLTLAEAFRVSCLPCYIRESNHLDTKTYDRYLQRFGYGNEATLVETKDPFWQGERKIAFWIIGKLAISQEEQIDFLKKVYDYNLPVSKRSIDITKKILIEESNDHYILSGKLGRSDIATIGKNIGWYVGYVEKNNNVFFFATNIESPEDVPDFGKARQAITRAVLKDLKIL